MISLSEIVLFIFRFLAIRLMSLSWLDSTSGAMALAVAAKIDPYLSTYSIAFAEQSAYFIHCQMLATMLFISWGSC